MILSQIDDAGSEYVCSYASRLLKGAEKHYSATERECLVVVWGIKEFHTYLYGVKFTVVTDHVALKWLMNISEPNGRLARWSIYLQAYDFQIVHRQGSRHCNADAISRPVLSCRTVMENDKNTEENNESNKYIDIYMDEALQYYLKFGRHKRGLSNKQVKRVEKQITKYVYDKNDDEIYLINKNNKMLLVPKVNERTNIIIKAHALGHFQKDTTVKRIRDEYFWKDLEKDVDIYIRNCDICKRNNVTPSIEHPAKALRVKGIFDRIGIDLVFGLPTTKDGYNGLLVITEYLTKYPYVEPIKTKTAIEVAQHLWKFICLFGPPKVVLSDQGNEFNNAIVDNIIKRVGAEHVVTSAYHPRTNGQVERFNYEIVSCLRRHCEQKPEEWPEWIPYVLLAYRTRIHTSTKFSPFELMFGRKMNGFKDWTST